MKGNYCVYYARITPLMEESLAQKVYDRLPVSRQKKADACKLPRARAASLTVGFLAEYALRQQNMQDAEVVYTASGAPEVIDKSGNVIGYISLSHSGEYAACAISSRPVGMDLQQIVPVKRNVLHRFMRKNEELQFAEQHKLRPEDRVLPPEAGKAFLWQWTAKESYMKLTEQGMRMGFEKICVHAEKNGTIAEISDLDGRFPEARGFVHEILEGYCLTVCMWK